MLNCLVLAKNKIAQKPMINKKIMTVDFLKSLFPGLNVTIQIWLRDQCHLVRIIHPLMQPGVSRDNRAGPFVGSTSSLSRSLTLGML